LPFCIFVGNKIYVISKSWLQVVLMARYLKNSLNKKLSSSAQNI
jgi:hypothetical protein